MRRCIGYGRLEPDVPATKGLAAGLAGMLMERVA